MDRIKPKPRLRISRLGLVGATVLAVAAASGSCFGTQTTLCERTGLRCGPGLVCSADQDACIDPGGCGDGVITGDEVCDDGNVTSGDGCSADCLSNETCGNRIIDSSVGEMCDDGNLADGDGCSSSCIQEACGNGIRDPGEVCDDGNRAPDDGCSADCMSTEICGNGITENDGVLHEQCDRINSFPLPPRDLADCNHDCTLPKCGDGYTNHLYVVTDPVTGHPPHVEECDDGSESAGCNRDCTFARCGDGYTNKLANEECDDGANNNNRDPDRCRTDCRKAFCGDHVEDTGEMCDDGNNDNTDDCPDDPSAPGDPRATCQPATCGDGFLHTKGMMPHERCDKGDPRNGIRAVGCGSGTHCNNNCMSCDPDA
jgi:cysteine-rich repeat protein